MTHLHVDSTQVSTYMYDMLQKWLVEIKFLGGHRATKSQIITRHMNTSLHILHILYTQHTYLVANN